MPAWVILTGLGIAMTFTAFSIIELPEVYFDTTKPAATIIAAPDFSAKFLKVETEND